MIHKFNIEEKVFDLEFTTYTFLNYQRIFGNDLLRDVTKLSKAAASQDLTSITMMLQFIYACILNPTMDIKEFTNLIPFNKFTDVEFIKYLSSTFTKLFSEFSGNLKTPSK